MDLKKRLKGFFTLSCKRSDGFTLVELIVVIAILAILGGVAVPAYSGYVKKANMQADISLVSEIEHALTLAYYNQDLSEGDAGFIMLSPNEDESFPDDMDSEEKLTTIAMEKTFGSNWEDAMQLKYDNWGVSWNTISYEAATNVVNSPYVQNFSTGELMSQVQVLTSAVKGLEFSQGGTSASLYTMYNYGDSEGNVTGNAIDSVMAQYYPGKTWEQLVAEDPTAASNLLVLATASSINDSSNYAVAETIISDFAMYTAYASTEEGKAAGFDEAYKTFQAAIANTTPENADNQTQIDQIKTAYNALKSAAGTGYDTWKANNGDSQTAFNTIMSGVGNAMEENGDAIIADLGNADMFTSGIGSEMYNDYLNSAYAIAGSDGEIMEAFLGGDLGENGVLIQYVVQNGNLYITKSMPNS